MMADSVWVVLGLVSLTAALLYYARVEMPLREDARMRQALRAFAKAVELRFPIHAGTSARVASQSMHVGAEMDMDPWQMYELEMASWLRDVGLCAIPYRLLNSKP